MPKLEPGIYAPHFTLSPANTGGTAKLSAPANQNGVLIFFPSTLDGGLTDALVRYQERAADFAAQSIYVMGISDAPPDALADLARAQGIAFPLLSDTNPPRATAQEYGVVSGEGAIAPTAFVLDRSGLIRATYAPADAASLPHPAAILRALSRLATAPHASPLAEDDWIRGPRDAPVVLTEYSDYQCKHCADLHHVLEQILLVYAGKVALVHRHFPLRHSHPQAQLAAEAAEAAGAQGKYWEMHDRLFAAEQHLERERIIQFAGEIRLDLERFTDDLDTGRFASAANADSTAAMAHHIKFPPSLFVNQILFEGPRTPEAISARLDALLACYATLAKSAPPGDSQ